MTSTKLPKVISFVNNKGGCGKTSTAVNSLGFFQKFDITVKLIDCDSQRSAARTAQKMDIPYEEIFDATELLDRIPAVSKEYDLIIIDGPANSSELNRSIISESSLVLIPCRPTTYDIESAENTIKFLKNSQRINIVPPVGAAFLNGVTNNSKALKEAQEYFMQRSDGLSFLKESIPHRQCVGDIGLLQKTIFAMEGRAAKEVAAKYHRLFMEALTIYNLAQEKK